MTNSVPNLESLIRSARQLLSLSRSPQANYLDQLEAIVEELERLRSGSSPIFSSALRRSVIDSFPWELPFFKELMAWLDAEDRKKFRRP